MIACDESTLDLYDYDNVHCDCDSGLLNKLGVTFKHANLDRVPHFDAYMRLDVIPHTLTWIGYHIRIY